MESAFGVDHGISKGLPSALRGMKVGGDPKKAFRALGGKGAGHPKGPKATQANQGRIATMARVDAHAHGRQAAKQIARGEGASHHLSRGRDLGRAKQLFNTGVLNPAKRLEGKTNTKRVRRAGV
jgi:hypothetical protein